MDSSKHREKCLSILDNKNFVKITDDPTEHKNVRSNDAIEK